ncbi:putative dna-directed rna polymerase i subunit [Diaporthe ampelina]|uniref:Putative dna-directed rna polymerase i subunit n=1 Tax=Diaporthe ampelina TaxID=1214573 RepID=A0A0G2H6Z6_9PEZI|nr:putative dna-directed rna polymerase i subunit [Diaporthe ampelina]
MAGARAPSGSLRSHASTASKASRGGVFGTQPSAPKLKPSTFVGSDDSDSDSGSDSSSSDSDISDKKKVKQTPLPKQKADVAKATPAKSPTVNGLKASVKKEQPSKNIKKETTSSSESSESGSGSDSDSESDSVSSSGKEPVKAPAKGHEVKKTKPEPVAAEDSESSSTSSSTSHKAKKTTTRADRKQAAPLKSKAKAVKQPTPSESGSDSESSSEASSAESESDESGSGSDEESEDPDAQIQQQIKDDVKSAKATKARDHPASSSRVEASTKKIMASKSSVPKDFDGDIEMTDQSTALTNGGAPTKVGSVPEFVAPDFHLRKLDGSIGASDVAGFFEKAKMEGKQVWYITAPASLPVTVVQDLTIQMDSVQKDLPVLTHNGDDYSLAFEDPSASSSFRLLIPNKKGQEYSELDRPIDQLVHFTRSETFPPEGPASVTTTQTVSKTTRASRPQPEGLRARYTPLGVPASKKALAPNASSENKSVANVAAQEVAAISTPKSSSKKKRKHDGENGPEATPAIKDSSKSASAEKSAKKQKTIRDDEHTADGQAGRKETPLPSKQTPVPIPVPIKLSSAVSTPDAKAREGKERKDKKKNKAQLPSADNVALPNSPGKSPAKSARTPKKNTPILPPLGFAGEADYIRINRYRTVSKYFQDLKPEDGDPGTLLNLRHLALRHDKAAAVLFLAECSHLEAELDSIAFGDPFDHPESIICHVIDLVVKDPSVN